MVAEATTNGNGAAVAEKPETERREIARREVRVVVDDGPVSNLMDTARFEHLFRVSGVMAASSLLPEHLRFEGTKNNKVALPPDVVKANCFRIVNQALRWGFDPFAIVDETFVVGGKLGYSGKLVAAVVNAKAGLVHRLQYEHAGAGDNRTVTVWGTFKGEDEPRPATLRLGDAKTENPLWRKDPDQKLIYSGVVKWARRHCPEVVLGVMTDDDLDRMQEWNRETIVVESPQGNKSDRLAGLLDTRKTIETHAKAVTAEPEDSQTVVEADDSLPFTPQTATSPLANELASKIGNAETPEELAAVRAEIKTALRSKKITATQSVSLNEKVNERGEMLAADAAQAVDDVAEDPFPAE